MTKQKMSSGAVQRVHAPAKKLRGIALAMLALLALCLVFAAPAAAEDAQTSMLSATENGIITLTGNVVLNSQYTVPEGVVMIDGKGFTISASDDWSATQNGYKHLLLITSASTSPVTIKNVTFENKGKSYGVQFYNTSAEIQHILEDVWINASVYSGLHLNGANVSVKNLHISNSGYQSIDLSSGDGISVASSLYLDGDIELDDALPIVSDWSSMAEDNPIVSGAGFDKEFYINYDYIYENQYHVEWKKIWNKEYPTANDGFVAVVNVEGGIPEYYTSLTLFSQWSLNGIATLLKNAEITSTVKIGSGSEVTIDLNGYSITGTGFSGNEAAGHLFNVMEYSDLMIINSGDRDSKIISDGSGVYVEAGSTFIAGDGSSYIEDFAFPTITNKITFDVENVGIRAYGFSSEQNGDDTEVYLLDKTVIETDVQGIIIYGSTSDNTKCFNVSVFVNGDITGTHPASGTYEGTAGIATNGKIEEGNCVIILGPQAVITAATGNTKIAKNDDAPAIMANGNAMWIIVGSTLEGDEAVSMKAGQLVIFDGSFKATGQYADPSEANDNGSEMTGATISVTNTYEEGSGKSGVTIVILGGTFESTNGNAIFAGQSNTHKDRKSVLMSLEIYEIDKLGLSEVVLEQYEAFLSEMNVDKDTISFPSFTSGGDNPVIYLDALSESAGIGIASGLYSTKVNEDYLLENYHNKQVEEGYIVTNMRTVTIDGGAVYNVVNGDKFTDHAEKPANPTKDGYTFGGWYTDAGCTTEYDFNAPVTADITLYAKWTENKQTNTGGGGGSSSSSSSSSSKPGSSSSSSSSSSKPTTPVEPETPTKEPVAGEVTVETEVTDGGEVKLETPTTGGSAADEEAKITGVILPTGTEGKVTFIPVSEQAAPAGKETQTKKVFEINIPNYEKGKLATIKFQMTVAELTADGKTAADVALWHFDEETGEWTKLVTSYIIVDGIVYFEAITNDFSPFAIIYEDTPVEEPTEEPETPASPAPILAVLAGLGAVIALRRK